MLQLRSDKTNGLQAPVKHVQAMFLQHKRAGSNEAAVANQRGIYGSYSDRPESLPQLPGTSLLLFVFMVQVAHIKHTAMYHLLGHRYCEGRMLKLLW